MAYAIQCCHLCGKLEHGHTGPADRYTCGDHNKLDFPARRAAQLLSDVTMELVGISPEEILEELWVAQQIMFDAAAVIVEEPRYGCADAILVGEASLAICRYFGIETAVLAEGVAEA